MKAVTFFRKSSVKNKLRGTIKKSLPPVCRTSRRATELISGCVAAIVSQVFRKCIKTKFLRDTDVMNALRKVPFKISSDEIIMSEAVEIRGGVEDEG